MAVPGLPAWLSHVWYGAHSAVLMAGLATAFSFRIKGGRNMPARGPALLVANHQSFLDPPIVGVTVGRTIHYLARKTLFRNPLFGRYIQSVNGVPVDQEGMAKDGLKAIIDLLRAGEAVVIFPEGERTRTGEMQPLKAGMHLLFKRAPVPIVPVGIAGAFDAFPRTQVLPVLSPIFMPATRATIAAVVGKPLEPKYLSQLSREAFVQTVFDAIQTVQREAEQLRRKS